MINKKTLLILGAGASVGYGYPSGQELMRKIVDAIKNDGNAIENATNHRECHLRELQQAIPYSGQPSIDAFLQHRPEFADYGKAAIAYVLLRCESMNSLFELDVQKNWYLYLFNKMNDKGAEQFENNQLKIVTFNYDTSLENFFYWSLRNSFNMNTEAIKKTMQNIEIIHVHGRLRHIPWEQPAYRVYGDPQIDDAGIGEASRQLHIIHEDIAKTEVMGHVKAAIEWAEAILFLGFGYHPLNMERMPIPFGKNEIAVLGTTYGMTDFERKRLDSRFGRSNGHRWTTDPKYDIIGFFRNCWAIDG